MLKIAYTLVILLGLASGYAQADNLECSNGNIRLSVTNEGNADFYTVQLSEQLQSVQLSRAGKISDLVAPVDYPFNSQVKLDMGDLLSELDIRFNFAKQNVVVSSKKMYGSNLACKVSSEFSDLLKQALRDKTKNAM